MINIKSIYKLSVVVALLISFTGCTKTANTQHIQNIEQDNSIVAKETQIEIPNTKVNRVIFTKHDIIN